ncbi:hypothetical protein [Aeromonas salmonicida]
MNNANKKNDMSEQGGSHCKTSHEEQQKIVEVNKNKIKHAPTVYEWDIKVKTVGVLFAILFPTGILFLVGTFVLYGGSSSGWGFIIVSILVALFSRYLWLADKNYHYRMTTEGLITTYQDAIPEMAYDIVRVLAWLGGGVCVIAVTILGPIALVGAGGMALFAFFFTNFKKEVTTDYTLFNKDKVNLVKVVRDISYIRFETVPFGYSGFANIYCHESDLNRILLFLLPTLSCDEYREFKSLSSLMKAPHNKIDVGTPRKMDELQE